MHPDLQGTSMTALETVTVATLLLLIVSIGGSALIWAAIADGRG